MILTELQKSVLHAAYDFPSHWQTQDAKVWDLFHSVDQDYHGDHYAGYYESHTCDSHIIMKLNVNALHPFNKSFYTELSHT